MTIWSMDYGWADGWCLLFLRWDASDWVNYLRAEPLRPWRSESDRWWWQKAEARRAEGDRSRASQTNRRDRGKRSRREAADRSLACEAADRSYRSTETWLYLGLTKILMGFSYLGASENWGPGSIDHMAPAHRRGWSWYILYFQIF